MGLKGKLALILAALATLMFLTAMVVPWWYWKEEGEHRIHCMIDGTCRRDGFIFKNNGNQQWVYDVTMGLMIGAWFPWLYFLHSLLFRRSHRYGKKCKKQKNFLTGKLPLVLSALLTMALLAAAIIVFGVGMVESKNLPGLYDDVSSNPVLDDEDSPTATGDAVSEDDHTDFGPSAGWYFAMFTFALIPLALLFGLLAKNHKNKQDVKRDYPQSTTTTTTSATSTVVPVGGLMAAQQSNLPNTTYNQPVPAGTSGSYGVYNGAQQTQQPVLGNVVPPTHTQQSSGYTY